MADFVVIWYDDFNIAHRSKVYAVDPVNDRLLVVVNENGNLDWVSRSRCQVNYAIFERSI